jgi:signal transduction histidine kinase
VGHRLRLCGRQTGIDIGLAVFFALLDTGMTLVGASWWPHHPGALAWVLLGIQAGICLSLIFRRRFPLTILAVIAAFTLAVTLLDSPAGVLHPANHGNVWAPYASALAAYGPLMSGRSRRIQCIAVAALTIIVARPWQPSAVIITIGLLRTAVGPLVALYVDARQRLVRALTERAEQAEHERDLEADRARADERAKLAGEMHDVVTHRVSLMVLQAGALQLTAPDEPTRRAADELRGAGVQALDELRDLVGILRTTPDPAASPGSPGSPGLAGLVAESTSVGTPAELVEDGDPALASPLVARTAFRIVREALTNVRKHAPGARIVIRVRYEQSQVRVSISNTPATRRVDPVLVGTGSGLGLSGLRQRIELVHGTLRVGPTADGGFCVDATLPAYVPTAESVV